MTHGRLLIALIMAFGLTSTARAQNADQPLTPPATQAAPAQALGVPVIGYAGQTSTPTPTPAPFVGVNVDNSTAATPAPSQVYNPQLPAGYPSGTGPARAPMIEQKQTKSEIVPVIPGEKLSNHMRAVLRTSMGDITIRLDRINAPHTVDYFVALARGEVDFVDIKTSKPVKKPFYNGLLFHRVVKNTLIQTGDPFGTGRGDTGQTVADEIKPTMKFDRPGLVAMAPARAADGVSLAKNSNSSQFFITAREMPQWNGEFTIFGEVEDGMDVVQKISNAKVGPTERPIKRIYLTLVEIIDPAKPNSQ